MDTALHYCKSWFWDQKRPTELWSEAQAEAAHNTRSIYAAIIGPVEHPSHIVELTKNFVAVSFMDGSSRPDLVYRFREISPGQLFLSMAIHCEYFQDSNDVARGVSYSFEPSGTVEIRREYYRPTFKVESASSSIDVSSNYSRRAPFGEYSDLLVRERMCPSGKLA
jgi:hypothetical protein